MTAILWDLDGVIVDSGEYHFRAYVRLMRDFNVEVPRERFFGDLFGRRNYDIIQTLLPGTSRREAERLAARKEEIYRGLVAGHIGALPGARELIERAHQAGLRQAVVSSTPCQNLELIRDTLGLRNCFDTIVGEEDARKGKPDPEGFLVAAQRLEVASGDCVVIEDSPAGIEAACAGGMRAVGVATTRARELLTQADLIVDSLEDERVWRFLTEDLS